MDKLTNAQQKACDALASGEWKTAYELQVGLSTLYALHKKGYAVFRGQRSLGAFSSPRTTVEFKLKSVHRRTGAPAREEVAQSAVDQSGPLALSYSMTPEEFRDAITALASDGRKGQAQTDAARVLGCDARTVRRYIAGERAISPPVVRLIKTLVFLRENHPRILEKVLDI